MSNDVLSLFGSRQVRLFGFARAALLHGLELMGISRGDSLLVPSFICDVVLAPLNRMGVEPVFYSVGQDLRPNLQEAERLLRPQTRALLAVNYFGFPQDWRALRAWTDGKGLRLIEDNAHGFVSCEGEQPLGLSGDISICSFRKSLPVPDGAALVLNDTDLAAADRTAGDASRLAVVPTVKMLVRHLAERAGLGEVVRRIQKVRHKDESLSGHEEEHELESYLVPCTLYSRLALLWVNIPKFRKMRRQHYESWLQWCVGRSGVCPIWQDLPAGVVPLALPLHVGDPAAVDRLRAECHGAEVRHWPRLPESITNNVSALPSFHRNIWTISLNVPAPKRG